MRIAGIVLAVLLLPLSVFIGATAANKSFYLAKNVSTLTAGMSPAALERSGVDIPSAGRLKAGGALGLLASVAALALLVLMFVRKPLVPIGAAAAGGLALLACVVYPYVQTGPLDGMAPRAQAMLAAGLALGGALGTWLAARKALAARPAPAGAAHSVG